MNINFSLKKRSERILCSPTNELLVKEGQVCLDTNQFIGNHVGWIVIYIIHNTIQAS